ncbi:T9SS type A sorting domain-containing protein [Phaeodactylibacter xiamenensis]|uniref:T9SS type A sorting domain-containing protein n=1 Tax=Phaeodactylibacter xiamenensis TaxID=1524460 RepID=UPI003BA9A764
MKQTILLFVFILSTALVTEAQVSLVFTPQTIEKEGIADPNDLFMEIVGKAYVVNEGDEPVSIQWVRNPDILEEWETMICDNNQCYPAQVSSNIMEDLGLNAPITLNPGDTTNIDVHLRPRGVAGEGTVIMEVYDLANPDEVAVSADFNFTASLPSSTNDLNTTPLTVFPNPTADYFNIRGGNGVDRVVLYNVLGREMRSFNVAPGQRYYIGDLPNGLYLASMVDNNKGIVKTLRLKKSSVRP